MTTAQISTYLRLRIRPRRHHDTRRQCGDRKHLQAGVSLAANPASRHGGHTTEAPKNDMDWYGDVECESPIIQHVDCEKQDRAGDPFPKGNRRCPEKVATVGVELIVQCRQAGKHKLEKCD
jgi:hypothetical protein